MDWTWPLASGLTELPVWRSRRGDQLLPRIKESMKYRLDMEVRVIFLQVLWEEGDSVDLKH